MDERCDLCQRRSSDLNPVVYCRGLVEFARSVCPSCFETLENERHERVDLDRVWDLRAAVERAA